MSLTGIARIFGFALRLDAAVPIVTLVFPVSTGARWQKIYFGQVLHHFVAELDGRVEAQRCAVISHEVNSLSTTERS
jgi:hypothetical protein